MNLLFYHIKFKTLFPNYLEGNFEKLRSIVEHRLLAKNIPCEVEIYQPSLKIKHPAGYEQAIKDELEQIKEDYKDQFTP